MNVNEAKFRKLIASLYDDDHGISEESHNLLSQILSEAGEPRIKNIDATDGRFYLTPDSVEVMDRPSDYESCGTCGFDHSYEPDESNTFHHSLNNNG
jgi:hypothetical protein